MNIAASDGGTYRRIVALALPTVAYNVIEMSLGLTDLFMVRSYGEAATAALGLNRQVTFLIETLIFAISVGVVTLVSQSLGRGEKEKAERVVSQSLIAIAVLSIGLSIAGYGLSPTILNALQASPDTVSYGVSYLRIYFFSMLFLGVNAVSAAALRAAKNPWSPLKIVILMSALNIPMNYWLIHGGLGIEALGVRGAAIGTVIARVIGSVLFIVLLVRGRSGIRFVAVYAKTIDFDIVNRVFRVGLPVAMAGLLRNGARLVFIAIAGLSTLGVSFHAAVGLGLQVRLLCVLPALAFQVATATLVGNAIGRNQPDEAEVTGRHGVYLLAAIMGVQCGIIILAASPIARSFIVDPEAAALGARVLRWFAVGQFFSALAIGTQGALSGAGDTKPVAWVTFITQWLILVPLAFALLVPFGMDPIGPLIAWAATPVLTFALLYWRFATGHWRSIRV